MTINAEKDAERDAQIERHKSLFSEWLKVRARLVAEDGTMDDATLTTASDRERELALLICAPPSPIAWVLHDKIEVLKQALADSATLGKATDNSELVMLAGVEADVYRMVGVEPER